MKRKKMFRNLFLLATVFAVLSAMLGCKQPPKGGGGSQTTEVTVTVKKGAHVKKAPDSFKVNKGDELGFTQLKKKMPNLEFESGYELGKIRLDNAQGREITNASKHKFDKDTTIFIVSKAIGGSDEIKLTELKVDGVEKSIEDTVDCGKTKKEKVKVEVSVSPADAEVLFEPGLEGGFWKLEVGKKTLKITVKKGTASKVYTVNIERVDSETPVLKKLSVGDKIKEGAEITSEMEFKSSESEVEVVAETDPAGAKVTFTPKLKGGKLSLKGKETVLKITVGEDTKKSEYTVKVKKTASPKSLVDLFMISAGSKQGENSVLSEEDKEKILNGEEGVTVKMLGPKAFLILASQKKTWTSFRVNGEDETFGPAPLYGLSALGFSDMELPEKGGSMDVKIEIEDNGGNSAELNFKIERLNETADVPVNALIIGDKPVTGGQQGTPLTALADGSKPEFESGEPAHIEIQCPEDELQSVTIDGNVCQVKTKKSQSGSDVWYAEYNVTGVKPGGKDITIVMTPKKTEDYHTLTWTFKLNYKDPVPIPVEYEINGKGKYNLDKTFIEGVEKDSNPSINIEGKSLNVKLTFNAQVESVKINDRVISGGDITKIGNTYKLLCSVLLDTSEKQIEITITPQDKGLYSSKTLKFKAKGNGNLEVMKPALTEISGDQNLSKSDFLDKLTDGSKPLYKTFGSSADLVIYTYEYDYEFLCQDIKINGEAVSIKKIPGYFGNTYKIEKSIPVTSAPIDVKIEFIGKENISDNITWTFQVQNGGEKPKLPQRSIRVFRINGVGDFNNPLPESLTGHLIDGTNPVYEFDGKKALVEVGSYDNETIQKVIFKEGGVEKAQIVPQIDAFSYVSKYEFEFTDTVEHTVEAVIYPKDTKYGELTYSFKLKRSGKNAPLPLSFVGIDGKSQKSGYAAVLNAEKAILQVQSREDVILEVKIGEKDTDEQVCEVNKYTTAQGIPFWETKREVVLPTDSEKTFVIRVKPKDSTSYRETLYEYKLKGTKIANNNAEFVLTKRGPKVVNKNIKWTPGLQNSAYIDDYGSKAVTLQAYTVSPRATVKYQFVDIYNKPIAGQSEKTMTNANGVHTSDEITFFTDKPTIVKAWVIAEDGITTDEKKGVWKMAYNPVPLTWGYEDKPKGGDYKTRAYDLIEIERDKVKDNRIYLVVSPWNEVSEYTVDNSVLPTYQTAFVKLGHASEYQDYYKTSIDVSTLLDNSVTELEAILKMKRRRIDCLTYKIKIKVKS